MVLKRGKKYFGVNVELGNLADGSERRKDHERMEKGMLDQGVRIGRWL